MRNKLAAITVSYNSSEYLENCLSSFYRATKTQPSQLVVVDNASRDQDAVAALPQLFAQLSVILNSENVGFAKACNQGIRSVEADYYLLLNPDCVLLDGAVDQCLGFLETAPEVGIVGCRVENPDRSLQLACRRSIPAPSIALYRFLGLGRLFPRSRTFGRYNYTFMDEHVTHEVEAVSGSFLMFRAAVAQEIGLLSEDYFLYGEDLDFCYRAGLAGWKIIYYPAASVLHHKRRSSSQDASASNFHFYNAMKIFYRKHYSQHSTALKNKAVLLGIDALYRFALLRNRLLSRSDVGSDS